MKSPWALALLLAVPAAAQAPTSGAFEAKIALESSMESRLEARLRQVFNTSNVVAMVGVDLAVEKEAEKEAEAPRELEVLPGIPLSQQLSRPGRGPAKAPLTTVRRVSAKVLVDPETFKSKDKVREAAEEMLGTDASRGDKVEVLAHEFKASGPPLTPADFLKPSGLFPVLWLLLGLGALAALFGKVLLPLLGLFREWLAKGEAAAQAAEKRREIAPEEAASADAAAAEAADWTESRPDLPFSFLQERDLPALLLLLQKARPITAAVVVHYLPPNLAAEALSNLSAEVRRKVVTLMSRVTQLNSAQVRAVEESIRSRINYLMGGEHKLAQLLSSSPAGLQKELLGALTEHDPSLGDRLRRRLVLMEDLALLDPAGLKALLRRVPLKSMAAVLKSDPALKAALLPKAGGGVGEWLSQEIDLAGDLTAEALAAEQKRVLASLGVLVREGRVILKREEAACGPEPAPGPQAQAQGS
jgi:flagellar motor switch protein FliG